MSGANSSDESIERDSDLEEKLKGDSIGDTLYSEKWVLKTLMKLTQDLPKYCLEDPNVIVELDETLESDLCLLWDMSAEPDVAVFLFHHDILDLMKCVISQSCAPRLTELSIGILANCSSKEDIAQNILSNNELILLIIDLLVNNDSPTIVQTVRLLNTLLCNDCNGKEIILGNEKIWTHVTFILHNSLNEELLCITSLFTQILTSHLDTENYDDDSQKLDFNEILCSIIECIAQLRKGNNGCISKDIQNALDSLIYVVYNLSRIAGMRKTVQTSEDIERQLEAYLLYLNQRLKETSSEEITKLISNLVMALTIFHIAINSCRRSNIFELSANIGILLSSIENGTQHIDDFRDVLGDCFGKMTRQYGASEMLNLLDGLTVPNLSFILRTAHQTAPETMQELLHVAADSDSYNKVTETWKSVN